MSISIHNLNKFYGEQHVLRDISLSIDSGKVVAFIGPNGAGKSTTMKCVTGYIPFDSGSISVCGIDVRQHPIEAKRLIGYLPEHNPLYLEMYVREYLQYVARLYRLTNVIQRVNEVIEQVGLTPECAKRISQLSKGYRQRVGLAQAIIHDPQVLILDEPTTGLDPNQIVEIRQLIRDMGKSKTVILSTHIMQEVAAICDSVIVINHGQIVANQSESDMLTDNDNHSFLIEVKGGSAEQQRATQALIDAGLDIRSVSQKQRDMEEVFHTLTNQAKESLPQQ
ncbi:MAG: ATP-binding cassette domain-containing protein [Paludibacteraceae bacterium]|nr:ATP-binding cassette domain-containing protein [Paludibacteraceae bacterium]